MPSLHAERELKSTLKRFWEIESELVSEKIPQRSTSRAIFEEYQTQGQSLRGNSTVEGRPDKRRRRLQSLL